MGCPAGSVLVPSKVKGQIMHNLMCEHFENRNIVFRQKSATIVIYCCPFLFLSEQNSRSKTNFEYRVLHSRKAGDKEYDSVGLTSLEHDINISILETRFVKFAGVGCLECPLSVVVERRKIFYRHSCLQTIQYIILQRTYSTYFQYLIV